MDTTRFGDAQLILTNNLGNELILRFDDHGIMSTVIHLRLEDIGESARYIVPLEEADDLVAELKEGNDWDTMDDIVTGMAPTRVCEGCEVWHPNLRQVDQLGKGAVWCPDCALEAIEDLDYEAEDRFLDDRWGG